MKTRNSFRFKAIGLAIFVGLVLWASDCFFSPPLRVSVAGGVATIDVQILGEYNSSLSEIAIRDTESNTVVWRAIAGRPSRDLALWTFSIHPGMNPRRLGIGDRTTPVDMVVAIPGGDAGVKFFAGHRYEVAIRGEPWFGDSFAFHAKANFLL